VKLQGASNNRVVSQSGLRQLEWVFVTPVLLLLVQDLHAFANAAAPKVGSWEAHVISTRFLRAWLYTTCGVMS
jgi:hypothetical protein